MNGGNKSGKLTKLILDALAGRELTTAEIAAASGVNARTVAGTLNRLAMYDRVKRVGEIHNGALTIYRWGIVPQYVCELERCWPIAQRREEARAG